MSATNSKAKADSTASQKAFIVTIDGPAGSGKSTVSSLLAQRLSLNFLTTGAFYRGLAYLCRKKGVDLTKTEEVTALVYYKAFEVQADVTGTKVIIDKIDVTKELSTEEVALVASKISAYPNVRLALLDLQRDFARPPGLIAEGRDCGTVVFPNANVKIFLTASLDKRATRRLADEQTIANRDNADTGRKTAPLAKAKDTIEIDSSALSIEEVVDKIVGIVKEKWKK